jgi:hypothetical protein
LLVKMVLLQQVILVVERFFLNKLDVQHQNLQLVMKIEFLLKLNFHLVHHYHR